jgi:hypothetical protein
MRQRQRSSRGLLLAGSWALAGILGCPPHLREDAPADPPELGSGHTALHQDGGARARADSSKASSDRDAASWVRPAMPRPPSGWHGGGGTCAVDGGVVGWIGCTAAVVGGTDVTVAGWLPSHHVRESESAKACFVPYTAGEIYSPCECDKSLLIPGLDLDALVCSGRGRTELFAVIHDHLRRIFDAPTGAWGDVEVVPDTMALSVDLDISVDGDALVFSDRGDCPRVLASVDAAIAEETTAGGRGYFRGIRQAYGAVCATVGRWRWSAGHFVHVSRTAAGSGLSLPAPVATSGR